jgi:hypothetical protein
MLTTPYQETAVKRTPPVETERSFISAFLKQCFIGQCLALGGSLRDSTGLRLEPGRQDNRAQPVLRWRGLSCLVVLLCSLHCYRASAQVMPSVRLPPSVAIFGTFTALKPTFHIIGDKTVWGGTVGGYIQSSHLYGLEVRGSINRWGGYEHQEAILAGPRAAMRFGRFTPYAAALGGAVHSSLWYVPGTGVNAKPYPDQVSADISALIGVDFHMAHHISLRLGEAQYSRVLRSDRQLNSLAASAGIVYRLPF